MWDERAPAHAASPDYGVARFAADPDHISDVVAFDRPLLGSVDGLRGVHLQCHIGTDTVSLARLGAADDRPRLLGGRRSTRPGGSPPRRAPTSTSSSPRCTTPSTCSPAAAFDLVYTGIGAIIWLPDIDRWAGVVADAAAPGGRLFMREGHPVLSALAEPRPDGLLVARAPVLRARRADGVGRPGTYVATDVDVRAQPSSRSGTTASARSSPRCSTTASSSRRSSSTTPCRGTRCPVRWRRSAAASGASATVPSACRTRSRSAAVKRR